MPTYLYWCRDCGTKGKRICSFDDLEAPTCPECSLKMIRRYTPVHVRLDTFVNHDNILSEWESNGELEPPAGSIAHEEKYGKQYFHPHLLPT